ncbi:unnamed protein product [Nezara viridula]|uniref:MIP18 family-like domain-containing protein n=1 Tax=Nezara viridula TaxID=85310 RepID=A0A9P0GYD1_NEZVI|nr:unnamed protein product [Nezara viridula]
MTSNILQNVNPKLFLKCDQRLITDEELNDDVRDLFDEREVFDLIRNINDPEHPLTLEELHVVDIDNIMVDNDNNRIEVLFTPTIPHCSLATLIGLTIRVQLLRSLPSRFKVRVKISPGTHNSENAINKQLGDKERVAAAMENSTLLETINNCIATVEKTTKQF